VVRTYQNKLIERIKSNRNKANVLRIFSIEKADKKKMNGNILEDLRRIKAVIGEK